jgi:hypothetical protein
MRRDPRRDDPFCTAIAPNSGPPLSKTQIGDRSRGPTKTPKPVLSQVQEPGSIPVTGSNLTSTFTIRGVRKTAY